MINITTTKEKYILGHSNYQEAKNSGSYCHAPIFGKTGII